MKLPYFKGRSYLSGVDWIIGAIDSYAELHGPAGNHSTLVLELESIPAREVFTERLRQIYLALPVLAARLSRDWVNLAPYWKIPRKPPLADVDYRVCTSRSEFEALRREVHNRAIKSRHGRHLSFIFAECPDSRHLLMTFDHKMLDARGAELFLNLFSYRGPVAFEELLSGVETARAPQLKDWILKFAAGRKVQRRMIELSRTKFISACNFSLKNPQRMSGPNLDCHFNAFSAEQTSAILEKSIESAGIMMESVYLLAACSAAVKKILAPQGDASIMAPVPVDMRKPNSEFRSMLFNRLSFMFLGIHVPEGSTTGQIASQIKRRLFEALAEEFPENFILASRLSRIAPHRMLMGFMRLFAGGNVASFAFTNVGRCPFVPDDLLGSGILDVSHMPRIPTPPGLGIFFTSFKSRLQYSLVHDSRAISRETADALCNEINRALL